MVNGEPFLLAYLGPETFIPALSVIAGVVGLLLAFGKNVWAVVAKAFRRLVTVVLRK
jgi:hypothetical protein